jgi:hypothetical protein
MEPRTALFTELPRAMPSRKLKRCFRVSYYVSSLCPTENAMQGAAVTKETIRPAPLRRVSSDDKLANRSLLSE